MLFRSQDDDGDDGDDDAGHHGSQFHTAIALSLIHIFARGTRYEQQTVLEKQASISADEPCLYGSTYCIFTGVLQFGFRSSIDPDCMGIDFADGTYPQLLETEAADEKTSGYGETAFRKIPYFRSDGTAGTG